MSKIGDRIALESRGGPRTGVITAVRDPMITVRWDSGGETSLVPGAGALRLVETAAHRDPHRRGKRPPPKGSNEGHQPVEREETRCDNEEGLGQEVRQAKREEGILTIKEGGDQESCEVRAAKKAPSTARKSTAKKSARATAKTASKAPRKKASARPSGTRRPR